MCNTAMMPSLGKELSHLLPFKILFKVTFPEQMQTKPLTWCKQVTQEDEYMPDMEMG